MGLQKHKVLKRQLVIRKQRPYKKAIYTNDNLLTKKNYDLLMIYNMLLR